MAGWAMTNVSVTFCPSRDVGSVESNDDVVAAGLTVMAKAVESNSVPPLTTAAIKLWAPTPRLETVSVATPLPFTVAEPIDEAPSRNCTVVPGGKLPPGAGLT